MAGLLIRLALLGAPRWSSLSTDIDRGPILLEKDRPGRNARKGAHRNFDVDDVLSSTTRDAGHNADPFCGGSAWIGHNFALESQGRCLFDRYPIIASSGTPFRPAVIVKP